MTRDEIYQKCVEEIDKVNCLLLQAATGFGKTMISIKLCNQLFTNTLKDTQEINILILVAKRVHKQTWREEIGKWGGLIHPNGKINIRMECYESLHKCLDTQWTIVLSDEVHHLGSEARLELMKNLKFKYFIGLSATIPRKLKAYFTYRYHAHIVSCDLVEAIEDDVLPEPEILLFPLMLDNRKMTETWEINTKVGGPIVHGEMKDIWKYKKQKVHAILSCTQKQKCMEYDKLIDWEKRQYQSTGRTPLKLSWLYHAGKRLEFLADIKLPIIKDIMQKLYKYRSITFCKTIAQAEEVSKNCIHSKNADSDEMYKAFNAKIINHISAVNILNENANLVDCKYAIFCNLSSSEVQVPQRIGRSLRHKSPVIVIPYYAGTREEELAKEMVEGFNKEHIRTIHSIQEI